MSKEEDMEADKNGVSVTRHRSERFHVEGIVLIGTFILSILSISITDFSPLQSHRYWGVLTLVLAAAGIILGWSRAKRLGLPVRVTLFTQLVHWCATGVAVAGVFMLLNAGRLNDENTGLVLLLMLGLAAFLDGYRVSWYFSLIGLLMFAIAIVSAYIEEYLWVLLIIATGIVVVIIFWEKIRKSRRHPAKVESPE
ncbi:MAG: hypothetical protein IEMM0001_1870 [bacterium]|nr:MAG: hypothetical protein IEMM0001_1870 [bacterium]